MSFARLEVSADVRKAGASFDLPIALGILGANGDLGERVCSVTRFWLVMESDRAGLVSITFCSSGQNTRTLSFTLSAAPGSL